MILVLAISLVVLIITVKLLYDYGQWKKENYNINHTKEWWIVAACSLPSVIMFTYKSALVWWLALPLSAAMVAFFIWLVFDGIYNLIRLKNWWYTGTNDADDAATDNFLQRISLWQHKLLKIGGVIILETIYIHNLK
jgi:hypothetical protein